MAVADDAQVNAMLPHVIYAGDEIGYVSNSPPRDGTHFLISRLGTCFTWRI